MGQQLRLVGNAVGEVFLQHLGDLGVQLLPFCS